jgi:hypothetical protein
VALRSILRALMRYLRECNLVPSCMPTAKCYEKLTWTSYVANYKQSKALRELRLDHTYLTGREIAVILRSLTETPGEGRDLHLDVSENNIEQGLGKVAKAIAGGYAPRWLSVREMEFEDEGAFRKLVRAMTANTTITHLDISRASLPCDASEETCHALANMFSENKTLDYLDLSGEESRLESSKLGVGINRALHGLKNNMTLRVLRIPCMSFVPSSGQPYPRKLTRRRSEAGLAGRKHSCRHY